MTIATEFTKKLLPAGGSYRHAASHFVSMSGYKQLPSKAAVIWPGMPLGP